MYVSGVFSLLDIIIDMNKNVIIAEQMIQKLVLCIFKKDTTTEDICLLGKWCEIFKKGVFTY